MADNKIMFNGVDYTEKDIDSLGFYKTSSGTPETLKLTFSGAYAGIVFISGQNGQLHGVYVVTCYGAGTSRTHVTELESGSFVSFEISEDEQAVTFDFGGSTANRRLAVLTAMGTLVSVE